MTGSPIIKEGVKVYLPEEEKFTEDIDDIVGLEEPKEQLISILKTLQKENIEQLKEWGIEIGGNVLVVGPFGMGKTSLIRALAKKEQLPLVEVNLTELLVTFPNQTDFKLILNRIHTITKNIGPCIILLDEFEPTGILTEDNIGNFRRIIYRFIQEFSTTNENVPRLLIAVTSYPIKDDGILNFFDHHIVINELEEMARFAILKKYLEKTNLDPSIDLENLLRYYASEEVTGDFSKETLKRLVQGAAYKAIYENRKEISENDLETAYQQLKKTHVGDLRIYPYITKTDRIEDCMAIQKLDALELEVARLKWMINATSQMMHHALRLAFSDNREFVVRLFEHFEKNQRPYALHEIAHITGIDEDAVKKVLKKKHFAIIFPKLGKRGRVAAFDRESLEKIVDEFTFMRK